MAMKPPSVPKEADSPQPFSGVTSLEAEFDDLYQKLVQYAAEGKTNWSDLTVDQLSPFVQFSDSTVIIGPYQ